MARGAAPGERRGGRVKGTPNKKTMALSNAVLEANRKIGELLPAEFKGDAHALLMYIYKDEAAPLDKRLAAASAAIGYEKHKLAAVQVSGDQKNPVQHEHKVRVEIVRSAPAGS